MLFKIYFIRITFVLAIIKTGGKQYIVTPGQKLKIEKLDAGEGEIFVFDQVLLVADGERVEIGTPLVKEVGVETKVLKQGRAPKITILKYHSKTRHRKKIGHRQPFTEIEITKLLSE